MSKESIRSLLEAHGSFPDKKDVQAGFESLFELARDRRETVDDLASGFSLALDQWSHVDAVVDPSVAQRLREWVLANWAISPYELCERLCGLLVNVPSPEVAAFLTQQREQSADPDLQQLLDGFLADLASSGSDDE
jgi:hypothetical protein